MKKIYLSILASVLALTSLAQTSFYSGMYRYVVVDEAQRWVQLTFKNPENSLEGYTGVSSESVPATVTNDGVQYTVIGIGAGAFVNSQGQNILKLPEGIMYIDNGAFDGADFGGVRVPASCTLISPSAFMGNKFMFINCDANNPEFAQLATTQQGNYSMNMLTNKAGNKLVGVPGQRLRTISDNVYYYVTAYTVPEQITEIGEYAFAKNPNMTSCNIHSGVTKIGDGAFYDCEKLTSVSLPNPNVELGNSVWSTCINLTAVSLPQGMEKLTRHTFYCCGIKNLTLPEGMKSVGMMCFASNELTSVTLPESLELVDSCAFQMNTGLTSINLKNVKRLDHFAFMGCTGLKTYTCNGKLEYMSTTVFCNTGLVDAQLPEGLKFMDGNMFFNSSSLRTITIPSTVETIIYSPVTKCYGVQRVQVAEGNTHFVELDSCLYEINEAGVPWRLVSMPAGRDNKVLRVREGVTTMGRQAVRGVAVTEAYLPASITNLDMSVFSDVTTLTLVQCLAKNPPVCDGSPFTDAVYEAATLVVPLKAIEKYRADEVWGRFANIEGIDTGEEPEVPGDIDGDGTLDVNDVNMIINALLAGEDLANGDVNGDGKIDVEDINALINMLLEK